MRFGKTLRTSIYEPWKSYYIDYTYLKTLLREDDASDDAASLAVTDKSREWSEEDESAFVEELINAQLEKVNAFQVETYKQLQVRTSRCEWKLEKAVAGGRDQKEGEGENRAGVPKEDILREAPEELDSITKEINELEKYSRLNFTGFLKAAKKHDRRRGSRYKVRPLLQVRLAALPFNSEDYSSLLHR